MKGTRRVLTALMVIVTAIHAEGQTGTPVSELSLKGKWMASCPFEVVDISEIQICPLCAFEIDPSDNSVNTDFEMTFQADSITLNRKGNITMVPYQRNSDNHSIHFTCDHKEYAFRVFISEKERILEGSDGLLLVLHKAE